MTRNLIDVDLVQEVTDLDTAEEHDEKFDFSSPEDVLIETVMHDPEGAKDRWDNYSMELCHVIRRANPEVTGAASYEDSYVGYLDYTIMNLIDPPGEGFFVVEGITGYYSRGDGWTTDDDMEFYFKGVRPATEEDKKLA